MKQKRLIVNVAGLGFDLLEQHQATQQAGLTYQPLQGTFPALTCVAQAEFRTGETPNAHGLVANGRYFRDLHRAMFWEQSANLIAGPRIWDNARDAASPKTVGMLFWQQSLGERADVILSPAPIHKHHGGMIMDCYSQPTNLYATLCKKIGKPFPLHRYWGPLAAAKVGDWIATATAHVMQDVSLAPDLLLTYLPSLDYDLQRFGPASPQAGDALQQTRAQIDVLLDAAQKSDYDVVIFGDYAIAPVHGPAVFPNQALADAGLLAVRTIRNKQYVDLHTSRAFAMVDHEIAHVYVREPADQPAVRDAMHRLPGIAEVLDQSEQRAHHLAHDNGGEFLLIAEQGHWLAYPWWRESCHAPDFATHVDIHNKPGYDPCELFFGRRFGLPFPPEVSQDTTRIRGSHGCPGRPVAWASTCPLEPNPTSLLELARTIGQWLEGNEPA